MSSAHSPSAAAGATRVGWSEIKIYDSNPFAAWAARRVRQGAGEAPPPGSRTQDAVLRRGISAEAGVLEEILGKSQPGGDVIDLRSQPESQDLAEFTREQLKRASFRHMIQAHVECFVKSLNVTLHGRIDLLRREGDRLTVVAIKDSPAASPEHIKQALFHRHVLDSMGCPCSDTVIVATTGKGEERFRVSDYDRVLAGLLDKGCGFYRADLTDDPPQEPSAGQASGGYHDAAVRRLRQIESLDLIPDLAEPDRLALLAAGLTRLGGLAGGVSAFPARLKGKMLKKRWERLRCKARAIMQQKEPSKVSQGNWCVIDVIFVEAREQYQFFRMQRGDSRGVRSWNDFKAFWADAAGSGPGEMHYYGDEVRVHLLRCAEAAGSSEFEGVLRMLYADSPPRLVDVQKRMRASDAGDPFASLVLSYHLQDVVRCFPKLFSPDLHPADVALTEKLADIVAVESAPAQRDWQKMLRGAMAHRLDAIMVIRDCLPRHAAAAGPGAMSKHIAEWFRYNSDSRIGVARDVGGEMQHLLKEICIFYTRDMLHLMVETAELLTKEEEQWKDDISCLYGLRKGGSQEKRNINKFGDSEFLVSYTWEVAQEVKFREDKTTAFLFQRPDVRGSVEQLDQDKRTITLKFQDNRFNAGRAAAGLDEISVAESSFIPAPGGRNMFSKNLVDRIRELAMRPPLCARRFLAKDCPAVLATSSFRFTPEDSDEQRLAKMKDAIRRMDDSVLVIQGPPGTGKTRSAAKVIEHLRQKGKTVLVSSNSHAAIVNLLNSVSIPVCKVAGPAEKRDDWRKHIKAVTADEVRPESQGVVGSTVHGAVKFPGSVFDYLVVDEAGQVGLANLFTMTGAAKNIVLAGDQMQLKQPLQDGVHTGECGKSCLEFFVGDGVVVVEPRRGFFLPETYRMCVPLTDFISRHFYNGQLQSHQTARDNRVIRDDGSPASGIRYLRQCHVGNMQTSDDEIDAAVELCTALISHNFLKIGSERRRPITFADVLVISPYNAHVSRLKQRFARERGLLAQVRIGTVDLFQGQQAGVVVLSMGSSSGAGGRLDFLLDPNRMNVALSRAQALTIVIASEELLKSSASAASQMVNLNRLQEIMDMPW